jgi:hypothetical protein
MSLKGRPLPTADVGSPVAQLGGHLSGGELARPTGAGRPVAVSQLLEMVTAKQTLVLVKASLRGGNDAQSK